ncbi:MAG: HAD family hydrolase [Desulforhopalus sp.]|nr:HAD family hydrolase [Desulforhopalus sp.]
MHRLSIIFDLDGTLLDTLTDIAETANSVLASRGFPTHPPLSYKHFIGNGLSVLIERMVPPDTEEYIRNDLKKMFSQLYSENWTNNCCQYDGIGDMLRTLQDKGVGMAVLSNKPHVFTTMFVERYFPRGLFSCVYGQREGVAIKPDPTVALAIAEQLGKRPRDMLFVGDTAVDIRTGKASGMTTVGVSWGFRSVHVLQGENPDLIINSPMELPQYVQRLT